MLTVGGLGKTYGRVAVLHDVGLEVGPGEAVGLIGVSGAGKTTLARCVVGQESPTRGEVRWDGALVRRSLWRSRGERAWRRHIQMVFQDPRAALDPRWTVARSLMEPMRNLRPDLARGDEALADLLGQVGLDAGHLRRYPHELSTGQCQRVCVARALAPEPRLLVLDEPLSALDLPVQAQIVGLLKGLARRRGLSYLFISHDIAAVGELCRRVLVLEAGRVVEEGRARDVLTRPAHPYTRALVTDTPVLRATPRPPAGPGR
ncbi:hypothetical protein Ssi03_28860 [Sphaerisporangium siamense]|uniref:ABC-type glutathione transport system ATPase component n=1 Tax=Sphaerisporangium siamense TaxID=795645 RepID=A0A7W7DEA8_9ACTN|nr:ABC transporter ATP-binding protein [Sphaerisporangium siamense]MBB4704420.1 ABC-type glutathione transport system ATPase component [Sphaerisporangium siamense]GII84896.1 hypothetical protein Ssi03_28860 [Sphaerisporangium siamense]